MSTSSRRSFLKSAGLLSGGLATFGFSLLPKNLMANAGGLGLPYYKQGAPFSQDLRNGVGESFTLQGIVYQQDGKTPLADAIVEIWHCDERGHFDFSNKYTYRGKTLTDKHGRYSIKTHFPGKYKEKGHYKMSRIFVLVNGPGYLESFSQLYFDCKRKPYIDNKHWAACPMAERPSLPKLFESRKQKFIMYDHFLKILPLFHVPHPKEIVASQLKLYSNNQIKQYYLTFGKSQPGQVVVRLLNKKGQVVQKHFFKDVKPEQHLAIDHYKLQAGLYTCSIYTSRFGDFIKRLSI